MNLYSGISRSYLTTNPRAVGHGIQVSISATRRHTDHNLIRYVQLLNARGSLDMKLDMLEFDVISCHFWCGFNASVNRESEEALLVLICM